MSSSDSWNFSGNVTAGAIGPNAQMTGGTVSSQQQVTADLGVVAKQLAELIETVKAGGDLTQSEQTSVEQVALAEQAARSGNESAMRQHLKAAGQWALAIAKQLALTAAETAIKTSIGG